MSQPTRVMNQISCDRIAGSSGINEEGVASRMEVEECQNNTNSENPKEKSQR